MAVVATAAAVVVAAVTAAAAAAVVVVVVKAAAATAAAAVVVDAKAAAATAAVVATSTDLPRSTKASSEAFFYSSFFGCNTALTRPFMPNTWFKLSACMLSALKLSDPLVMTMGKSV